MVGPPDLDPVRPVLEPPAHLPHVHDQILHPHQVGHELDELETHPLRLPREVDHVLDVREGGLEHDHVQLEGRQALRQGGLEALHHRLQVTPGQLLERPRVQGVGADVDSLEARLLQGAGAAGEHGRVRRQANLHVPRDPGDHLFQVRPEEGLPAGELDVVEAQVPADADDPVHQRHGDLPVLPVPRRLHVPQALVVAVGAPEVAAVRHGDPEVRGLPPIGIGEHDALGLGPRGIKR